MQEAIEWREFRYSDDAILRLRIADTIHLRQSQFQKIEIMDSPQFGRMLVLDDIINVTEKDEFIYHEMITHVPLFTHPNPKNVLVIGGGDGGTIREIVKHPTITKTSMVEIDPEVVEVARKYLPRLSFALDDPRVQIFYQDAAAHIKSAKDRYDIIIVDSTDPIGPGTGLFSLEFYQDCYYALTDTGILTAQSESPFYDPDIVEGIYDCNKQVFPIVKMFTAYIPSYVSGIWSFLYCSKTYDPIEHFRADRFLKARLEAKYYNPEIHKASFALPSYIKREFNL